MTNTRTAKYCPDCRTRARTKEEIQVDIQLESKVCSRCRQRKHFSKFCYSKINNDGLTSMCKQCNRKRYAERIYNLTCQNPDCGAAFVSNCHARKTCYNCTPKFQFYSDGELKSKMAEYSGRTDFLKGSPNYGSQAVKRDWYQDYAQKIYGDPLTSGFGRSVFVEACERNNNGKGKLYLIKCFLGDEMFYKVGITSLSVKKRYSNKRDMPYNYELVWTIEGDPSEIWDMELLYKRKTKETRYQPDLWRGEARETFKCHGNCKILRKPIKNSPNQK